MSWGSSLLYFCKLGGTISFVLNQTCHSISAYRTNADGSFLSLETRNANTYTCILATTIYIVSCELGSSIYSRITV